MKSILFRPINIENKDEQNLVREFLADTKGIGGMKLEDEEFDAYRTAIKVRQEISPDFSVFAFLDQKIIGFLDVFPRKGYPAVGFVTFIYLLPVFRRQGLGKKLEKYALDLLKKYNEKLQIVDFFVVREDAGRFRALQEKMTAMPSA